MVTNSLVLVGNICWLTRMIESSFAPSLHSDALQRKDACQSIGCVDRMREDTAAAADTRQPQPFNLLWYSWIAVSIVCSVMFVMSSTIVTGKVDQEETTTAAATTTTTRGGSRGGGGGVADPAAAPSVVDAGKSKKNFISRAFPSAFALARFLWLTLSLLYCVLSIAVSHRGGSVELYSRLESGLIAVIVLVVISQTSDNRRREGEREAMRATRVRASRAMFLLLLLLPLQ